MRSFRHTKSIVAALAVTCSFGSAMAEPIIYSTHGDGTRLGTIDAATAGATDIGAALFTDTYAAAFDNITGELFTIVNGFGTATLARFNLATGEATPIGTGLGDVGSCIALEIADDGTIYAAGFDQRLWTVNRETGVATLVGTMGPEAFFIMDMAFDPTTGTLWGTAFRQLFMINPANATTTHVSTMAATSDPMGLMFADDGTMYCTDYTNNGELYEVTDRTTGTTTLVGVTGFVRPHGGDILSTAPVSVKQSTWGLIKSKYR